MLDRPNHLIRPATRAELPELSIVIAAAFETYRGAVPDRALDFYIASSADIGKQAGRGDILALESEGKLVGCAVYYANGGADGVGLPDDWAAIRTLAVHPKARSRGFGRSLVDHCIERARREGAPIIGLRTADLMKDAVAIYRKTGFERAPEHDFKVFAMYGLEPEDGEFLVTAYKLKL
jgi:ribosomal protein S18 acetylase RimI-like enzyme